MTEEKINVSDEIIAVCAVNAALKTDGVASMDGGITNTLSRNILGRELVSKGVKVDRDKKNDIIVDVHIIVRYGCKIPAVAWDIQENVKKEIREMTGQNVKAVNIHVQGVKTDDTK
ncbi:MAG: Asp23/Gls24 family envelope stress response protein [Clostridiales bacterium]|nr:Asp23/Gls24 family envelope stress response protein [Clostridiales bacterium]MDD7034774.1 Asp23/Gls24 family envelope stress response protein [Bacillota bacterium]MDY2921073.1 Asp23/Gls24 family envelope stress response protein [Lentihominibacter sp.]